MLQEKEFERVGGNRTIRVDVRILATTNRDIERSIAAGDFRQDLYFRLNVVPVKLPALRERAGEVEYLLKSFLDRLAKKYNKPTPIVSEEALRQLSEYHWPGNVRELQNYAERAVILAEENRALEFHDFISSRPGGGAGIGAKAGAGAGGAVVGSVGAGVPAPNAVAPVMAEGEVLTVEEMEKRLIGNALKKTKGNRNEAARLLGINVRTLRNKLNQYQQELGLGAELTGEDAE